MSTLTDNETKLTGNTWVRLGAVIIVGVALVGFIIQETKFRTNLQRDLQEMQKSIVRLTEVMENYQLPEKFLHIQQRIAVLEQRRVPDRFHKAEMRLWILETEKLNPGWKGGSLGEESH
jgi:N-dimethylarginine dimethylaminohydrolase